jgi:hypothetical protein
VSAVVVVVDVIESLRAVDLRCFDIEDGEWEEIGKRFIGAVGMHMLFPSKI